MKQADLLIRGIHVFAPEDLGVNDVAIADGKVAAIGARLELPAAQELDGRGKLLLPGVIETHAHMSMPFAGTKTMNTFYDGTYAGAFGGVTTLIDFAQQIGAASLRQSLRDRLAEAEGRCCVDYGFHITLTDTSAQTIAELPSLCREGYSSFKLHTTYRGGGLYVDTDGLYRVFSEIARCGGLVTVHAENDEMIDAAMQRLLREGKTDFRYFPEYKPDEAEAEAVSRCIRIARETGCKLLIRHISGMEAAEAIAEAQAQGLPVYAETCPQYLAFTREVYAQENGRDFILHPPIRGAEDREAIWRAICDGMKITLATDDCGFFLRQKHMSDTFYGVPGGLPGIETRLLATYGLGVDTGRITVGRLAEMASLLPAKLYGLYPQKGVIRVGSDADLVVLDPSRETVLTAAALHEQTDYTPFEGFRVGAALEKTISRGRIIVDGDRFLGHAGDGRLLLRKLPEA